MSGTGARLAHDAGEPHGKRARGRAQGRQPWAQSKPVGVRTATLADRKAADALAAAGGVCSRCEAVAGALIAVGGEGGSGWVAECLDRAACTERLRRLIAEEA